MQEASGLFRAGRILVLVGGIFQVLGGLYLIGMSFLFDALGASSESADDTAVAGFLTPLFVILGIVALGGAGLAFWSFALAGRGDARGAGVRGIAAGLLPPVQVLTLLGGIFLMVSEEAKRPQAP